MDSIYTVILLALLQYIYFTARVGFYRGKYGVEAPKTTGHDIWERMFRVQQNTLEQLIIFLPALPLFAMFVSSRWALLPGVLFLVGRQVYSYLYVKNPKSRGAGVVLSFFSNIALVVGALIGIAIHLHSA